jgi:uncharacterized protein
MGLEKLLDNITPDIYQHLKRAVEIGKGLDGTKLTSEQRQLCMQALIAYEHKYLAPEEHSGYIPTEAHTHCATEDNHQDPEPDKPIKWV